MRIFLLILIITLNSQNLFSQVTSDCNKKAVLGQMHKVSENSKILVSQMQKVINGEAAADFSFKQVFGNDFSVKETSNKISELEKLKDAKNGVLTENENLAFCLEKLELSKELEELKVNSRLLTQTKIALLKHNQSYEDSIRKSAATENALPTLKNEISEDSNKAISQKAQLESNLIKNESEISTEVNSVKKDILIYSNELTRVKIDLLGKKIEVNKSLEEKIKQFEDYNIKLRNFSKELDTYKDSEIRENFNKVETLWLNISKENYSDLFQFTDSFNLPEIPRRLVIVDEVPELVNLNSYQQELTSLKIEIIKSFSDKRHYELKLLNQLVQNSNAVRTQYYSKLGDSYFIERIFSLEVFGLIQNEVYSAPYRVLTFFYSKYLVGIELISKGKEGYQDLAIYVFYVLSLLGLFVLLSLLYRNIESAVDRLLDSMLRRQSGKIVKRIFSYWNKLKDNTQYILWFVTIVLIENSFDVSDYYLIGKVFKVYIMGKIIASLVTLFLGAISKLDSGNFHSFKVRASETSKKFKNIYLFYGYTMIGLEITVGRVYLYSFLNYFMVIYLFHNILKEAGKWEEEFKRYAERNFSGIIVTKYFALIDYLPKRIRSILILGFIFVFMIFDLFVSYTERFEISKKVSANLFKKQIENVEVQDGADAFIPQEYKDLFSLKSIKDVNDYIPSSNEIEQKIKLEVKEWVEEKSDEHSLVVFGDKGVGKTTLLKKIASECEELNNLNITYVKLPSKILDEKELYDFIGKVFNFQWQSDERSIYDLDNSLTNKTVVIIDETQNIFLSQTGGFEAFYCLISLINLNTKNIFWVMTFNKYSWMYLNSAFGKTQYFRNVFELSGWNDAKIKELIMNRHLKSSFRLSYDLLISATRSQDEIDRYASVESKFFKLLWELSRGNPRAALSLWLTALSRKGKNVFNVNIPREPEYDGIDKMSDDILFVLSYVVKHENLSSLEIESTTNMEKGLVRNAIKHGLEKNYLFKDNRRRYMVEISKQYGLIRYLKAKNFIYGN